MLEKYFGKKVNKKVQKEQCLFKNNFCVTIYTNIQKFGVSTFLFLIYLFLYEHFYSVKLFNW